MGSAPEQGELWGRHPQTWAGELEPLMGPIYDATLDALAPLVGVRLLDAGCGAGLALRRAADRGARVCGLDASAALLEVAAGRVPEADLRVGDVDALPHDDGSFDVVTAFNVIQYAVDPAQAVGELARVCRPAGRVAIGVWGEPACCETDALFARLRSLAPAPPGTSAPLACSEAGVVEGLLEKADLRVAAAGQAYCPFVFRDLEHAWAAHTSSGAVQRLIDAAGPDAVRDVIATVLETDRKADGELRQDNYFRYVIAIKPGFKE